MGLLDRIVRNVASSASWGIGRGIGNAIGNTVEQVGQQAVKGVTTDMEAKNQEKELEMKRKELEVAEEEKAKNLPPTCPHCGAATEGQLVCRFCDCKIVE